MRAADLSRFPRGSSALQSLNLMSESRLRGRSASDLALKAVQGAGDKLGDDFGLMVRPIEIRLLDVLLIKSDVQMALDFFARAHGDIKEASLVLKGISPVCFGDVSHR